ncbi:MAG: HAD-IIIA family hydrolase [Hyphomonadaceae bacterium]|nr:HAD-IIIA family hydrolase [Hyphomonadaceae bacterium]
MLPAPPPRRPAVFFDRDGTLNADAGYTWRPDDLVWLPGAREAVKAVNDAGWLAIVVTNQSGVARGHYDEAAVDAFHARMQAELAAVGARIDAFYACPFHGEGPDGPYRIADHPDRKPRPGLIRRAFLEHPIERARSVVVGDHARDVEAAHAAGLSGHLVAPGTLLDTVRRALAAPAPAPSPAPSPADLLAPRAAAARAWLFDHAFPRWAGDGVDAAGFVERIGVDGAPDRAAARRVRVQARQTYVFAAAGRLGWPGPWRTLVDAGAQTLLTRALHPAGGAIHALHPDGAPADTRRDLYDLAFVVFGLAHAAMAQPARRASCVAAASALLDWIDAHWAHPAGGYREGEIAPQPPRRQNPHMHLLEALLALHEATGDASLLARAARLGALFAERLFQPRRGALLEFYGDDWSPAPGETGRIAEPGHHFEWCWLLDRLARAGGPDFTALGERLRVTGELYGVDGARGVAVDEIWAEGVVRTPTARLWPQTERLKANLIRLERTGDPDAALAAAQAFDALMRYLDTPTPGLWWDRMDADGAFRREPAPASSFYHIVLALEELVRVHDAVTEGGAI